MRGTFVCAVAVCAMTLTSSASGAMVLGQSPPLAGGAASCGNLNTSTVQRVVASGPGYTVPAGGGVITSWRTSITDADAPIALRLFTGDPAGTTFTPVAESEIENVVSGTQPSFAARISVSGGELLGLHIADPISAPNGCVYVGSEMGDKAGIADELDVMPLGQPETHTGFDAWRINVEATLEPDADGDGFGDETQDKCPTDAATQSPCPDPLPPARDTDPPETTITKGAPDRTDKSKVKIKFTSDEPGSSFECKFDRKPFAPCSSPRKLKRLQDGKHKFKVRATDPAGNVDTSPAKDKFKVVER